MPFMPRKGEEATEFQTYALARCVYACKDHIQFTEQYQYPIPPSHHLFNFTQHLLVAGALLLLICHRGLQDPKLLDRTIKDVDSCVEVLKLIGQRFVGGTIGAEMVQNMKDNMKHSETWKTRQKKIAEAEAAAAASKNQAQAPLFPPIPLPGPRRIPGILQPSTGADAPMTSRTSPSHTRAFNTAPEDVSMISASSSARSAASGPSSQNNGVSPNGAVSLYNTIDMASSAYGHSSQYSESTMLSSYNTREPGYLYPTQSNTVNYGAASDWQQQPSQEVGQGLTPTRGNTTFLDDYLQMAGTPYTGTSYAHPSMMQTYNTPESQPHWPSDNLNFNIKALEEITARSYNSSFMNNDNGYPSNSSQYPFFQF